MRNIYHLFNIIVCLAILIAITACGSSGGNKSADYIPPFIDPNGGPVLKIDVGNSDPTSGKKSKINTFQKSNTESVKAYKLDGTIKGSAEKLNNGLWQIQVTDNSPTLIKANIDNGKNGIASLECLLPVTSTSTVYVNTDTTKIVYITWLNAFF